MNDVVPNAIDELPDTVNAVTFVGDYGFDRYEGPFDFQKEGTVWSVSIPTDPDDYAGISEIRQTALKGNDGDYAVAVADGRVMAGGKVLDVLEPEGEGAIHAHVDQYLQGD